MPGFGKREQGPLPGAVRKSVSYPLQPSPLPDDDPEEDKTALATLMIAAGTGTVFLMIVGAVIYLTMSYFPSSLLDMAKSDGQVVGGYVSPLDASCGKGWTKDMLNGKQLKCYLNTDPERLCNKKERDHLVAILKRYEKDSSAYFQKFYVATLGSIAAVQKDGVKLGIASGKLQEEFARNPDDPRTLEAAREFESLASGIMSGPNKLLDSAKDMVPEYQLINDVKKLLIKGYVSKDDFGWFGVSLVKKAHREIVDKKIAIQHACK